MKTIYLVCLLCFTLHSCREGYPSMVRYRFKEKKDLVEKELVRIVKSSTDSVPDKWEYADKTLDFMDDRHIYFKNPEEIIYLSFVGDSLKWEENDYVDLRMYCWYNGRNWYWNYDIDDSNKERIIKRLEDEILSKMKYKYEKEK